MPKITRAEAETLKFLAEAKSAEATAEKELWEARHAELIFKTQERKAKEDLAMNPSNRVLDLATTISSSSVETAAQKLFSWARISNDPIFVRFTSPGGSVVDGFTLYDTILSIRKRGIHVTTVALGWCASMAFVLLQSGSQRLVGPNSWMLVHEISSGTIGKLSDMQDEVDLCHRMNKQLIAILMERSKITDQMIKDNATRRDWWLSSSECIDLGLADEIYTGQI